MTELAPPAPTRLGSRAVPIKAAFRELGCGKTAGYEAIRTGTFPVPVIRVGSRIYVSRAELDHLLGERAGETVTPKRPGGAG